jgi:hypothetical protein
MVRGMAAMRELRSVSQSSAVDGHYVSPNAERERAKQIET